MVGIYSSKIVGIKNCLDYHTTRVVPKEKPEITDTKMRVLQKSEYSFGGANVRSLKISKSSVQIEPRL